MAESLFKANTQLGQIFQRRAERIIEAIWIALQRWAQKWSRNAARVAPRDTGDLARSFFVVPIRNGAHFTIILANHMQYGKWTEFGTVHIAHGHVLAWRKGDPPVMSWPAKDATLQYPKRPTAKSLARWNERAGKAMTPGRGEQMPYVRPTGWDLVPQIIADVQKIVQKGMAA